MPEAQKKTLGKRILLILFILFNAGVILWTALSEFSGNESGTKFSDIKLNWWFLFPAAGCWVVAMAAEVIKYGLVMKEVCGHVRWKLCAETVLLGRYYDNITPSGAGGQPFQIYHLRKNGEKSAESAAIPLVGFISMQFAFVFLGLLCFFVFSRFVKTGLIKVTSYIGLVFYAFFPVVILLFTFFEKTMVKVMHWFVKVLAKIRLVKDPEKTYESWAANITDYSVATRRVVNKGGLSVTVMILGLIYQIGICSIPFFVILAFGGWVNFFSCFVNTVSVYAAITIIPTPGNAGAAEGAFYAVFTALTTGYIFWAMMTWRFFVFYLFIIIGLLIYLKNFLAQRRLKAGQKGEKEE